MPKHYRFHHITWWSFGSVIAWELVEEIIESAIAYAISSMLVLFLTKIFSTLVVMATSWCLKIALQAIIKKILYKEGKDKLNKLKQALKWLLANKCTIFGILTGTVTAISGAGVIDVADLPSLMAGSVNLTPILYYSILGILTILCSFFPESIEQFLTRIKNTRILKEQQTIEKLAVKEIAQEEKKLQEAKEQEEKATAKAIADQKAQEERTRADAEFRAKVEAAKERLKAEKVEG